MDKNNETNRLNPNEENQMRDNASTPNYIQKDPFPSKSNTIQIPQISLPKGGGAIKGIDEKFSVNAANGTSAFSIPLPISPGRNGFQPALALSYSSGAGNSLFGLGWNVDIPSIQRKTDKQLPRYNDAEDSDVFMFSGAEDLVPEFKKDNKRKFIIDSDGNYVLDKFSSSDGNFEIKRYRPRIEGVFARIEKISPISETTFYWKVTTRENVVTFFGRSATHRIADPDNPSHVFKWLPEISFDDKGNSMAFEYKAENLDEVANTLPERNRFNGLAKFTNQHLKCIKYGNIQPYYPDYSQTEEIYDKKLPPSTEYLFEVVFDYGEHSDDKKTKSTNWKDSRVDAFSDYRAGFEIRTYRLCKRVMMFHHFTNSEFGLANNDTRVPYLVRSLDFKYESSSKNSPQKSEVTYLKFIRQTGYPQEGSVDKPKSLPPIEFEYQELNWNKSAQIISKENIVHAPVGLTNNYQWVDLYNEGISGLLTEQADAWYYKNNLGNGEFTSARKVAPKPSFTGISTGNLQLQDIEANGKKHVVVNSQDLKGYFELSDDNEWQPFRAFQQMPNVDFSDPNTRFIDLNGDGMPELVVSEENVFTWYPGKGKRGYDAAETTFKPFDEEQGPAIVFADNTQSIFLADMSGDGLADIVRIRNGKIGYWPNLGYGRFGPKVNMGGAPVFDHPDQFNPAYLHLADVSGTGATDILYLGKNKFKAWLNLSGNAWSEACEIDPFPTTEQPNQLTVVDLLGNGTSCLVWSSPLPAHAHAPMRYIDLMGGKKPHIMRTYKNNLGKETSLEYKSSTHFYLEDKKAGKPWVTKLPFPVHCVSKVEVVDRITDLRFTNKYAYHHGYYDHMEREFRGFGMVEQIDTEEYEYLKNLNATNATDIQFHGPPVLIKTWFHTGAYLRNIKILDHFKHEYWHQDAFIKEQFGDRSQQEPWLPDAEFKGNLSLAELIEAHRTCKGMMLRQETFALDGTDKDKIPYSVATHNCHIKLIQPQNKNRHAVFLVHESEAVTFSYERNVSDPRIAHTLNLEIDEFGNVLKSVSVVYARAEAAITEAVNKLNASLHPQLNFIKKAQGKEHIVYTETIVTTDAKEQNNGQDLLYYRLPVPWSVKTFEAAGVSRKRAFYGLSDFKDLVSGANVFAKGYEEKLNPTAGTIQLRLIEQVQTLLLSYDLQNPLPAGKHGALGMGYESYQLAYTPELVDYLYNTDSLGTPVNPKRVANTELLAGKFCHVQPADLNWWIRSGTMHYFNTAAGETRTDAAQRFYQPVSYTDPFGSSTSVAYYSDYYLWIQKTTDALANEVRVEAFDYRTLSPLKIKDINDNISEVRFDILGMVVGLAIREKDGSTNGDDFAGFINDLPKADFEAFYNNPQSGDPTGGPALLQHATARFVYDLDRYVHSGKSVWVATIARETHYKVDGIEQLDPKLQYSFEYSDGLGNVTVKKVQAAPGKAPYRDQDGNLVKKPNGDLDLKPTTHRWVGNGRTILNNKGKPIKQYEPYFSDSHWYEDEPELREAGVTPILNYDAAGRLVKTVMPDKTFSKVEFDAWFQQSYDQIDTVLESQWYADRGSPPATNPKPNDTEQQAAWLSAILAGTPHTTLLDSLGRPFFTIQHNRTFRVDGVTKSVISLRDDFYETSTQLDIEGNVRTVIDSRGNTVMQYQYDMLGHQVHQDSMDAGERWMFNNVLGNPVHKWDSRDQAFSFGYDVLQRPIWIKVKGGDGDSPLDHVFEKIIYGEGQEDDKKNNLRGKPFTHNDTAGKVEFILYDFKGNLRESRRTLMANYKMVVDWNTISASDFEAEFFTSKNEFDALNRPLKIYSPYNTTIKGSVITPEYNEANLLKGVKANLNGSNIESLFVESIDYDAKGQRLKIKYGNGTFTAYNYDEKTYRLIHLKTYQGVPYKELQDLSYTYDPIGNITHMVDQAQPTIFFNNHVTEPVHDYTYDAVYRLIAATGREHDAIINFGNTDNWNDAAFKKQYNPGDSLVVRKYTQRYEYDEVGNITKMDHNAGTGSWLRTYSYSDKNNRLLQTVVGQNSQNRTFSYGHHSQHGFIEKMPHLQIMQWNFKDELHAVAQQKIIPGNGTPETTWYVYDGSGQRIRKVTDNAVSGTNPPTKKNERIYLGGWEIYREYDINGKILERETLHIMDDQNRIVIVDTPNPNFNPSTDGKTIRYQYGNHLGSVILELNENCIPISYEEYHPYGTTAYQAINKDIKSAAKRYRYTGMERDEETGLEYHSARYYLPWMGRWTNCDPVGLLDGVNVYSFASGNPIRFMDPSGKSGEEKKFVSPSVLKALETYGLPYATEVSFDAFDNEGKFIKSGRFDVVTIDPRNGQFIIPELKGKNLKSFTPNQKTYIPLLESAQGAVIKIKGQKGGTLGLHAGVSLDINANNYVRVGMSNLDDFQKALQQVTSGLSIKHSFLDKAGKVHMFQTTKQFEEFLKKTGRGEMLKATGKAAVSETRTATKGATVKAKGATGVEKVAGVESGDRVMEYGTLIEMQPENAEITGEFSNPVKNAFGVANDAIGGKTGTPQQTPTTSLRAKPNKEEGMFDWLRDLFFESEKEKEDALKRQKLEERKKKYYEQSPY